MMHLIFENYYLVSVHVLTVTESTSNVWTAISTTTLYSELNEEAAVQLKRPATVKLF